MGPNTPGVVIGLGSIIAVCGAVLHWVHHNSASPMDFIERHLGFSNGGNGSLEALLITVLVTIITVAADRWALK